MGRGVSAGGGQSSLGYLFGGGETPTPQPPPPKDPIAEPSSERTVVDPPQVDTNKPTPTQTPNPTPTPPSTGYTTNNYYRVDGQNCGNFITDRPSTKVHAAPGGGSSLDYLFGNDKK